MAHTLLLELPDLPFEALRCAFDYEPLGASSRTAGGIVLFQEFVGGGLWRAAYQTKPIRESDHGRWTAWKLRLAVTRGAFKGYDPRRCYPIYYGSSVLTLTVANTTNLFDGTIIVTAAGGETISLSGLPANFIFKAGDYVSFDWLDSQYLVRLTADATADANGIVTDVTVAPWLRAGGIVPTTGTVVRPWCLMKIIPGSWSGERSGVLNSISFDAIQTLEEHFAELVTVFASAADRVNMLKPATIEWWAEAGTEVTPTSETAANYISDWNPSDPSQLAYAATGADNVSFGAAATAPDGTDTAIKVIESASTSVHELYAGAFYNRFEDITLRLVVIAKAAERSRFRMEVSNWYSSNPDTQARDIGVRALFDVATGTVITAATAYGAYGVPSPDVPWIAGLSTIEPIGHGWFKCSMSVTTKTLAGVIPTNPVCAVSLVSGTDVSYAGDGTSGMYFWRSVLLPPQAFEINTRSFFDDFDSYATIDTTNTLDPGYKWYVENLAPGWNPASNTDPSVPQSEFYTIAGSILTIIKDGTQGGNRTLNSASWNGTGWVGTSFQLPALFEARMSWDDPIVASLGYPAFWTVCLEGVEFAWNHTPAHQDNPGTYTNSAIVTTAATSAGSPVLTFAYVPTFFRIVGATVYSSSGGIPTPARILSANSTTITLDTNVVAPGVALGEEIHCLWDVEVDFVEVANNLSPELPHYAFGARHGFPGPVNDSVSSTLPTHPTGYDQLHAYQTLWLPATVSENGSVLWFIDGRLVNDGIKIYGLGINNAHWTAGDALNYPLFIGGGGLDGNFPGNFDYVAVYVKTP